MPPEYFSTLGKEEDSTQRRGERGGRGEEVFDNSSFFFCALYPQNNFMLLPLLA